MRIEVIKPCIFLPEPDSVKVELAKCATGASISRAKLRFFDDNDDACEYPENGAHHLGQRLGRSDLFIEPYESAEKLIEKLLSYKPHPHESVLEHGNFSAIFRMSRMCTHQLVRHRLGGITQESTRYVPYNKRDTLTLIKPMGAPDEDLGVYNVSYFVDDLKNWDRELPQWVKWAAQQHRRYKLLTADGKKKWKREDARYMLTHVMASWIMYTTNLRQWRHMVAHRDQKKASPEMIYIFSHIRSFLGEVSPVLLLNLEGETDVKG